MAASLALRLCAAAAVAAAVAWSALFPYRLTDGDSCLYAAMGHQIAAEGAWAAPTWAFQGEERCFHENPPGALWVCAALERGGAAEAQAALLANALWLLLLFAATWRYAQDAWGAGDLAAGLLLLHYPVLHYVVRAGLEIPFAACVVTSLAAWRRPGWAALLLAGLSLGAAGLIRGVFALAVPALMALDCILAPRRSGRRALAAAGVLAGAAALAAAFDVWHFQATGHSFWRGYWEAQLLPSLQEGGTPHPNQGSPWWYYAQRLLLYSLPWSLLSLYGLARRRAPGRDAVLLLAWIFLFYAGSSLAYRQGSRYLFGAWPAAALLASWALAPRWAGLRPSTRRLASCAAVLLLPLLILGKSLLTPRDDWWRAAELLRERRAQSALPLPAAVYGPFAAHDDRYKQFLRHHLGIWAFTAPEAANLSRRPAWRLQKLPANSQEISGRLEVATPLFLLRSESP